MKDLLLKKDVSKIYMLTVALISLVVLASYFSYAMFTVSKEKKNAVSIVTGNLAYTLTVDGVETNQLVVEANSAKTFTVVLSNPNNRIARFNFYYVYDGNIVDEGIVTGYTSTTPNIPPVATGKNLEVSGSTGSSETYEIYVDNEGYGESIVTLGVSVGLDYNDLSLPTNGHLFELMGTQSEPGLYSSGTFTPWEELLTTEVTYQNALFEEQTGYLISVDENGVLTTCFDAFNSVSAAAEYLDGTLVLADSVTSIGTDAFHGCDDLNRVIIPYTVTSFGFQAFYGCTGLTAIAIPSSVVEHSTGDAFSKCTSLSTIYYSGTADVGNWGYSWSNPTVKAYSEAPDYLLPELSAGVYDENNNFIYSWQYLTTTTINHYVDDVYDEETGDSYSIYKDSPIISVSEDGVLTTIGDNGNGYFYTTEFFNAIGNNIKIVIPNSVTSIGSSAFEFAWLEEVFIPSSVINIGSYAFARTVLAEITYNGTKEEWNDVTLGDYWNEECSEITIHCTDGDIIIPAA